jgi:hypothetical protein
VLRRHGRMAGVFLAFNLAGGSICIVTEVQNTYSEAWFGSSVVG